MNVAIEERTVAIELVGPMANFVGFEHEPENAQEEREVASAGTTLEQPENFLHFDPSAECSLRSTDMVLPRLEAPNDDPHDHNSGGENHDHDDHMDISASYSFECAHPEHLSRLRVRIFGQFPATEVIEVNVVGASNATSQELTAGSADLRLQ